MKSKKIWLANVSFMALIPTLFGCGAASSTVDIGVCLTNSSTTLNIKIGEEIKSTFSSLKVDVQAADNNVATQKSQVTSFINMGVKMIVVAPVQIESITTELENARSKGIKVVVSGANKEGYDNYYDAVTISDEFLLGSNIALLAKHWAESKLANEDYDVVVCYNEDNDDGKKRSAGMGMIKEPYLKNYAGEYIDATGNKVSEDKKVDNPAYLPQAAVEGKYHYHLQSVNITSGLDYMAEIKTLYPKTQLILCYMSGFASQMSMWVERNDASNWDKYGIFAGGVQGSEPNYILGSIASGVGESFTYQGETKTGAKSIFRGAISFGGADAAKSLAELSNKVYFGTVDVDYKKTNAEALGIWFTEENSSEVPDTLAVKELALPLNTPISDFSPVNCIKNPASLNTTILWQKKA